MKPDIERLFTEWRIAKRDEQEAVSRRRQIEAVILHATDISVASERTHVLPFADGESLRIVTRLNRKVDAGTLKSLARQNRLEAEAEHYFRWKAEVNLAEWRQAPESIVRVFEPAITTYPARPTFEWKPKGEKQ